MRYLSVCSGVEAASVAWHPLGWEPVGFSEIESFPAAVLAHHYPTVPNFGDLTKHETWPLASGSVELLVGGTPCQAFSVAGKRAGLDDPRGQLMLAYLDLAGRLRPRWIVWENVPGVLSSNGGRDFGAFLGGLEQLGYGWAYRVLDAQWVRTQRHPRAVPQRRRRVFVVGCLGDSASAAAVLFERESVQRNPAKGAKARQIPAADAGSGAEGGGGRLPETVGALCADHGNPYSGQDAYSGRIIAEEGRKWPADVTCTLNTLYGTKLGLEDQHALHGAPAFVLGEKPSVIWREGDQANAAHCVDFAGTLNCDKGQQGGIIVAPCDPDVAQTLSARDHKGPSCGRDGVTGNPIVVSSPAPVAGTLSSRMTGGGGLGTDFELAGGLQPVAYPLQDGRELDKRQQGGIGDANDPAYTVDCTGAQPVACPIVSSTLDASYHKGPGMRAGTERTFVATQPPEAHAFQLAGDRSNPTVSVSDIAFCLPANPMSDRAQAVATYPINGMTLNKELSDKQMTGIGEAGDPMFTIRAIGTQHAVATQAIAFEPGIAIREGNESRFSVEVAPTLRSNAGDNQPAVALAQQPVREVAATIGQRMRGLDDSCADNLLLAPSEAQQPVPFVKAKRAQSADDDETWEADRPAPTLNTFDVCDTRATVAIVEPASRVTTYERHDQDGRVREVEVAPTLPSTADNCCELPLVMQPAVPFRDPSPTLTAKMQGASGWAPYNEDAHLVGVPMAAQQPIAFHHNAQACQLPSEHRDTRVTDTLTVSQNAAVAFEPRYYTRDNKTGGKPSDVSALKADASKAGDSSPHVATSLAVRRLTPRECERLQGFPDDYTAIVYRKKPAADGPRYKAMGNSMAVNCMAWIGERIAAVNARIR